MEKNSGEFFLAQFDRIADYPVYAGWWEESDKEPPNIKDLPPNGFSIRNENGLVACGFVALTDCDFGVLTFWFCSPDCKPKDAYKSLGYIVEAAKQITLYNGRNQIFAYTSIRGMVGLLKRHGFINYDGHLRWFNG